MAIEVRRRAGKIFADISGRLGRIGLEKGKSIVSDMKSAVAQQFALEAEFTESGAIPWRRSARAIRRGGKTLDDTGDLRRAWTGQGNGSIRNNITKVSGGWRIIIGVEKNANDSKGNQFIRAAVFQSSKPVVIGGGGAKIYPRRVGISKTLVELAKQNLLKAFR